MYSPSKNIHPSYVKKILFSEYCNVFFYQVDFTIKHLKLMENIKITGYLLNITKNKFILLTTIRYYVFK